MKYFEGCQLFVTVLIFSFINFTDVIFIIMNLSPEGQKLFNKLISEMLEDGFVKVSDYTFYEKLGSMTVSLGDRALNIMQQEKCYSIIPEREFLKLANGFEPILIQVKYLLAFSMRQDMNRLMNFFSTYFWN